MNYIDIKKIEDALSIKLPDFYTSFMLNYPQILLKIHEDYEDDSYSNFYNEAEQLIYINKLLGFHTSEKYIKNKFCIGESGGGNYYLINLGIDTSEKVYVIDHEESVELYYDESNDTWDWDSVDNFNSIEEFKNFILSMFT